ncbi:MAG: FAD-dependent oxidoreductase [Parapedobacter sp.]
MMEATSLLSQYELAKNDSVKTLIVGAGIAGITAAQMLRKDGKHPVLIERHKGNVHPGYMLALMPMVDTVFDDLDVRDEYRKRSIPFSRYGLHNRKGNMTRIDAIAKLLDRYGDYRGIARGQLLETLTYHGCPVAFDTVVTAINQSEENTSVDFQSGSDDVRLDFDLVIIADGIHSQTRNMVLANQRVEIVDTHWGGWVVWAPADEDMDMGEELWGAGFFYGVYPVKDKLGVFLGGDLKDTKDGNKPFVAAIRTKLKTIDPRMERCLGAVENAQNPFFWPLADCRCPQWAFGKTILLGDSAAGFLPTAGIGAGMAMESAWVLTRMLRHAHIDNLGILLSAYEQSQKPRVESAQGSSRGLANMMFRQSKFLALLRDLLMHFVSVEVAIKPIRKLVAHPPKPDEIANKALNM